MESAALAIFHDQTNVQPDSEQCLCCSIPYPKIFISEHEDAQYGISLWPVSVSCPTSVPSQILAYPQCDKKALMLCKHCSAVAKTTGVLSDAVLVANSEHSRHGLL